LRKDLERRDEVVVAIRKEGYENSVRVNPRKEKHENRSLVGTSSQKLNPRELVSYFFVFFC